MAEVVVCSHDRSSAEDKSLCLRLLSLLLRGFASFFCLPRGAAAQWRLLYFTDEENLALLRTHPPSPT